MGIPWRYAIRCVDELGLILRQELIWSKGSVAPTRITDRARRTHEHFFHFTKREKYFSAMDELREGEGRGFPESVRQIGTASFKGPDWLPIEHHAVFPPEWPRWIISGWCPPDGTVLDPFSGAGTTALVATMLGRRGIGVDLSTDYCRLAEWRASDPKERARAAGFTPDAVAKVQRQIPGQFDLLDLVDDGQAS
jgi:DNA modification methylase